jgi:hypothetical protein
MSKRLRGAGFGPYAFYGDGWELTERNDATYVETDKITADTDGITFHVHSASTVLGLDGSKKTKSLIGTDICTSSDGSITVTNSSGKANLVVASGGGPDHIITSDFEINQTKMWDSADSNPLYYENFVSIRVYALDVNQTTFAITGTANSTLGMAEVVYRRNTSDTGRFIFGTSMVPAGTGNKGHFSIAYGLSNTSLVSGDGTVFTLATGTNNGPTITNRTGVKVKYRFEITKLSTSV